LWVDYVPDRDEEMLDRLGSSAPELSREKDPLKSTLPFGEEAGQPSDDPYGSGDYKNPPPDSWGQSDKSGWGNQGNAGNEGYLQGYESTNEDRTQGDTEMPDLSEKAHESTKQRDRG
jgi:hypothetical protein